MASVGFFGNLAPRLLRLNSESAVETHASALLWGEGLDLARHIRGEDMLEGCVQRYVECDLGFALSSFPESGVDVRVSTTREDRAGARMLIVRLGNRALATGTPSVVETIRPALHKLDIWQLFSPFGRAELTRALEVQGVEAEGGGFHHTLRRDDFRLPKLAAQPTQLIDTTRSPDSFDGDWTDAFGIDQDGQQVARSQIRWKSSKFIEIGVETHEDYRSRGYGLAVVARAAEWILDQDAVAHYPVMPSNIPSVRIPNRLGFRLAWQELYA